MKYIKTDTNIFEVIQETALVYKVIGATRNRRLIYTKSKCQTPVLGAADTLEELFDDIVVHEKDSKPYERHFLANCLHEWRSRRDMWPEHKDEIKLDKEGLLVHYNILKNPVYGGIWTHNGFKYVAKMNGEGEFELISTLNK